jgi:hypothetical protein
VLALTLDQDVAAFGVRFSNATTTVGIPSPGNVIHLGIAECYEALSPGQMSLRREPFSLWVIRSDGTRDVVRVPEIPEAPAVSEPPPSGCVTRRIPPAYSPPAVETAGSAEPALPGAALLRFGVIVSVVLTSLIVVERFRRRNRRRCLVPDPMPSARVVRR